MGNPQLIAELAGWYPWERVRGSLHLHAARIDAALGPCFLEVRTHHV